MKIAFGPKHFGPREKSQSRFLQQLICLLHDAEGCSPLHGVAFFLPLVDGTSDVDSNALLIGLPHLVVRHGQ